MEIPNKRQVQQMPLSHSSDIEFKCFMKFKEATSKNLTHFD